MVCVSDGILVVGSSVQTPLEHSIGTSLSIHEGAQNHLIALDTVSAVNASQNITEMLGNLMPYRYASIPSVFENPHKTIDFIERNSCWCRWRDLNPHDFLRSRDFKSRASAISPHRLVL